MKGGGMVMMGFWNSKNLWKQDEQNTEWSRKLRSQVVKGKGPGFGFPNRPSRFRNREVIKIRSSDRLDEIVNGRMLNHKTDNKRKRSD